MKFYAIILIVNGLRNKFLNKYGNKKTKIKFGETIFCLFIMLLYSHYYILKSITYVRNYVIYYLIYRRLRTVEYSKENEVKFMPIEEKLEQATRQIEAKIKGALVEQGLTQVDLAHRLGLTPKAVNEAIKGYTTPTAKENRKAIFKELHIRGE